mgnify:CR=1 FL=1
MADKPRVKAPKQRSGAAPSADRKRTAIVAIVAGLGLLAGVFAVLALTSLAGGSDDHAAQEQKARAALEAAGCTLQVADALEGKHSIADPDGGTSAVAPYRMRLEWMERFDRRGSPGKDDVTRTVDDPAGGTDRVQRRFPHAQIHSCEPSEPIGESPSATSGTGKPRAVQKESETSSPAPATARWPAVPRARK